jgi:hypothetical protein
MRQIHGRLARKRRAPPQESIHNERSSGTALSPDARGSSKNKKPANPAGNIAQAAAEYSTAQTQNPNTKASIQTLIANCGNESPCDLTAKKSRKQPTSGKAASHSTPAQPLS